MFAVSAGCCCCLPLMQNQHCFILKCPFRRLVKHLHKVLSFINSGSTSWNPSEVELKPVNEITVKEKPWSDEHGVIVSEWNISTAVGWIVMNFGERAHLPLRICCSHFMIPLLWSRTKNLQNESHVTCNQCVFLFVVISEYCRADNITTSLW